MAAFTITAAQNWHDAAFSGRGGHDSYTINGGSLTIDGDTRYGPNTGPALGTLASVNISATLGGQLIIDGTKVRLIPYASGSGTVPAAGATISQGGVSAQLLGVWSALNTTPTAAGAAMPASGWIKVRGKAGGDFAAGALTGVAATAKRADIAGWIEVIGSGGTNALSLPRLGTMTVTGAWWYGCDADGEIVTTSGTRGQQIQLPASVANTCHFGVWIETAPGSDEWDIWPNAWPLQLSTTATDERAKQVWIDAQGLLTIGHDGVNAVGWMPASGCRIRVPNVLLGNTTTATGYAANCTPATSRFAAVTSGGGSLNMSLMQAAWNVSALNCTDYSATDCSMHLAHTVVLSMRPVTLQRICASSMQLADSAQKLSVVVSVPGSLVEDLYAVKQQCTTAYTYALELKLTGADVRRVRGQSLTNASTGNTAGIAMSLTDSVCDDPVSVGGMSLGPLIRSNVNRVRFSSTASGTVSSTASTIFNLNVAAFDDSVVDGIEWLIATANTCHPFPTGFSTGTGVSNFRIRNVGSRSAPLDLGTVNGLREFTRPSFQSPAEAIKLQNVWFSNGASGYSQISTEFSTPNVIVEKCGVGGSTMIWRAPGGAIKGLRTTGFFPTAPATVAVGVHWGDVFLSDTVGALCLFMVDPIASTADQAVVIAGAPVFTGTGALKCGVVGDSYEWTMAYFAQGHTALSTVTMSGGTASNYLIEFRADTGSGWSAWQEASAGNLAAVAIDPAVGVRAALRITCTTETATNITALRINSAATAAAQDAISYPLDPVPISVAGVVAGSQIKITRTDTGVVVANDAVSGTSYSRDFDLVGVPITVELRKASAPGPYYQPWQAVGVVGSTGFSTTALQVRDDQ